MMTRRPAAERGHANYGWLDTHHSFSFAHYFDPAHMGFRDLRVINEDTVAGGAGFPTHPHRDMEIISYVVEGALEHRDSMGNGSVIVEGDVQRMSAGTGVTHSEFNGSAADPVRFLQIWIRPDQRGLTPSYEQTHFPAAERRGRLRLVASPDGAEGSVRVHQDIRLYASLLDKGDAATLGLDKERHAWIQVIDGAVVANGTTLGAGDGASLSGEQTLTIEATNDAHVLVFDLA